jgi:hypothetical protein
MVATKIRLSLVVGSPRRLFPRRQRIDEGICRSQDYSELLIAEYVEASNIYQLAAFWSLDRFWELRLAQFSAAPWEVASIEAFSRAAAAAKHSAAWQTCALSSASCTTSRKDWNKFCVLLWMD